MSKSREINWSSNKMEGIEKGKKISMPIIRKSFNNKPFKAYNGKIDTEQRSF